ncbi:hypothetical protein FNH07_31840 [Amycolatopsis bartoniae]|uniref:Uncharacterized protein n=2 Tax=Amycolatopsis bartoniae TaxID=941986 RepID=A0A8H9MEA3_9PSEU|nr:hypothetical protein FNH07_31840 [Amycolatopsis bartoniae]GHF59641.1 hypothetical protein GCM10017566_36530 [Amycolatopsis bartoniae]
MGNRQGMSRTLLGVYLNDHLAGAMAGVELSRRLVRTEGEWAGNGKLERLAEEIEQDRAALLEIMAALGEPVRRAEMWTGWLAEKVARFKLNGRIVNRSPLSRLVELEAMRLGVEGKVAGWRTLRARATVDPRLDSAKLDELITSGRSQITRLERLRARAAEELFGAGEDSLDA